MSKMLEAYRAARLRGVPILTVATPDQPATVQALREAENGRAKDVPVFVWDLATGLRPLGGAALVFLLQLFGFDPDRYEPEPEPGSEGEKTLLRFQSEVRKATADPDAVLTLAKRLPGHDQETGRLGTVLLMLNAQAVLAADFPTHAAVRQAVANLREPFKRTSRMLVLLGPEVSLPPELANDVIPLREEYPDDARLTEIITEQVAGVGLSPLDAATMAKAVDAVRGLSAFVAEQVLVMSLTKRGLDLAALRERKYTELEKIPGLKVVRERITLAQVGGKAQAKKMLRGEFNGRRSPGIVVILDEFEKAMAGSGAGGAGDSSGVTQRTSSVILTEMEDNKYGGMMLTSPPGVGKTLLALAIAGEFNVIAVRLDIGATMSKWVGESEANIRAAFRAIRATAGPGGAFAVATTNGQASISPEMRRRFTRGIWYDDLPTKEERRAEIWPIQLRAYGLPLDSELPDDAGWTGADVRNCCDLAWAQNISLKEAAEFLVPISKSDPSAIERLRATAKGAFLSTAYPGPYRGVEGGAKPMPKATGPRRARLDDEN